MNSQYERCDKNDYQRQRLIEMRVQGISLQDRSTYIPIRTMKILLWDIKTGIAKKCADGHWFQMFKGLKESAQQDAFEKGLPCEHDKVFEEDEADNVLNFNT